MTSPFTYSIAERFGSDARRRRVVLESVSALSSFAPVTRAPLLVSNRKDDDGVFTSLVCDIVREAVHENPASFHSKRRARVGILSEKPNRALNFRRERLAQSRNARLIEVCSFFKPTRGFSVEEAKNHSRRRRSRANTSSAGISFASPRSISPMRRSIS